MEFLKTSRVAEIVGLAFVIVLRRGPCRIDFHPAHWVRHRPRWGVHVYIDALGQETGRAPPYWGFSILDIQFRIGAQRSPCNAGISYSLLESAEDPQRAADNGKKQES